MKKLAATIIAATSLIPTGALADHEYEERCGRYGCNEYDYDYGNRGDNSRGRERGAFSPGPFDRSPVDFSGSCISLNCSGREDRQEEQPPE